MPFEYNDLIRVPSRRSQYFAALESMISRLREHNYFEAASFYQRYKNALAEDLTLLGVQLNLPA
ncbi:hypothetical protein FHT76_007831 [Rhizobium sp. BK176]|nr:hypothetical protein [Rhizobium sp. BK176]